MNLKQKLQQHQDKWSGCTQCPLHENVVNIVHWKGSAPCDILFLGRNPSSSEDVMGKPFVGNAAHIMDAVLSAANSFMDMYSVSIQPQYGYAHLLGCRPITKKVKNDSYDSCYDRVKELVQLLDPGIIAFVGQIPDDQKGRIKLKFNQKDFVTIDHPMYIGSFKTQSQREQAILKNGSLVYNTYVNWLEKVKSINEIYE